MRFSIVTPSFRQLAWLKRAVRSVADQQGVEVEHIIQDAGTGPELEEWVRTHSTAQLFVEKDHGMYDAVNRGLARAMLASSRLPPPPLTRYGWPSRSNCHPSPFAVTRTSPA